MLGDDARRSAQPPNGMTRQTELLPRRSVIRRSLHTAGIDRPVAWTVLGRGWGAVAGVINVLFIVRFLTRTEQGFYYTFASILAAQIFFELGLTQVILQYTSHEKARLDWDDRGRLVGDASAKSRVASLARWWLRWYAVASGLMVLVLVPAGWLFFSRHDASGAHVVWQLPWALAGLATAASLLLSPFLGTVEGAGKVAQVALIRLTQALALSAALWGGLAARLGLYAAPLGVLASVLVGSLWVLTRYRAMFTDLLVHAEPQTRVHWRSELWPFQWRTAATVCSGYFTFYFFAPVLFTYRGAVAAGQIGMSMSVALAISAFAIGWMYTKSAPFGVLIAKRQWAALDASWVRTTLQSTLVCVALCLGALGVLIGLHVVGNAIAERFLPLLPFAVLMLATMVSHLWFCESYYLRAHKKEPFVWISLLSGALVALSTLVLGRAFGAMGMLVGYACVALTVSLGAGTVIFIAKRRAWHEPEEPAQG